MRYGSKAQGLRLSPLVLLLIKQSRAERNNYTASCVLTPATPRTHLLTGSGGAYCRGQIYGSGPNF